MKPVSRSPSKNGRDNDYSQAHDKGNGALAPRAPRPTLMDVARQCKMSKATVSKALSLPVEQCPVKATTRQRILRIADEMGYRPNWRARSLAHGKSQSIGLLYGNQFPHLTGVYETMVRAFALELQKARFHLHLIPVGQDDSEWRHMLEEQRVDGCVVFDWLSDKVRAAFEAEPLPGVLLNIESDYPMTQVLPDDRSGAELAVRHLAGLGHKSIALYFGTNQTAHHSERHREEGFCAAMKAGGLKPQVSRASLEEFVRLLQSTHAAPTAVIGYSHLQAVKLLPHLWRAGLQVPRDLSLMAFNDVYPLEHLMPPLSAVSIPSEQIGKIGAEVLLQQIAAEKPPEWRRIFLPEKLVLRESTAPPPAKNKART